MSIAKPFGTTFFICLLLLGVLSPEVSAQEKVYYFPNGSIKLVWNPVSFTFLSPGGEKLFKTAEKKDNTAGSWGLTLAGKTGKFSKVKGLREKIQILLTDIVTERKTMVRGAMSDRGNGGSIRFFHLKGNEIDSTGSVSVTFLPLAGGDCEILKEKNIVSGVKNSKFFLFMHPDDKGKISILKRGKKQFLHFSSPNHNLQIYYVNAENAGQLNQKYEQLKKTLGM